MKKSICIETFFTEYPFEDRFQLAREAGFDYVEFWTWEDKDLEQILKLTGEFGLKIASFSGDQDYSLIAEDEQSDYISYIKRSLAKASFLGCDHLVIHSNALGEGGRVLNSYPGVRAERKKEVIIKTLQKLAPLLEREGIKLVLEALNTEVDHPGNFLASTALAAEIISRVDSPDIQLLYDIYHMQIMEGNIIETIRDNLALIGYIHVADAPGRMEPGTGKIDYKNIFKTLKELSYKGYIGFELFPSGDPMETARRL